ILLEPKYKNTPVNESIFQGQGHTPAVKKEQFELGGAEKMSPSAGYKPSETLWITYPSGL
ncbi:hypothetical protein, partial [Limnobacter litoralis]|uniref:hypothetical protein n=1 Tax=Limnobacter litoralis TaxID=481366 RepID=UPI0024E06837